MHSVTSQAERTLNGVTFYTYDQTPLTDVEKKYENLRIKKYVILKKKLQY